MTFRSQGLVGSGKALKMGWLHDLGEVIMPERRKSNERKEDVR